MDLMKHILRITGKTFQEAYVGKLFTLSSTHDGELSITHWDEAALGMPQPTIAQIAEIVAQPEPIDLVAYAKDARWKKEIGGLSTSGLQIATDDRSKQLLLGARVAADSDPDFTASWVTLDGSVHELNAAQIISISNAVLAHVNQCFNVFSSVEKGIADGKITTAMQIDVAFGGAF